MKLKQFSAANTSCAFIGCCLSVKCYDLLIFPMSHWKYAFIGCCVSVKCYDWLIFPMSHWKYSQWKEDPDGNDRFDLYTFKL